MESDDFNYTMQGPQNKGEVDSHIIYKLRRGIRLDGKNQGYVQVRTIGPLTENGNRMFLDAEARESQ